MTGTPDRSREKSSLRDFALAAVSGASLGFAWPGRGIAVLALVFLIPFFAATRNAGHGRRLLLSWLAGSVAVGISTGDATASTLASYFQLTDAHLVLAWLMAQQILGVMPFAVFGLLVGNLDRSTPWRAFAHVGSAWVVSEALREVLFPGAWLSLASALVRTPTLIQSAEWIGTSGVSFWIAGLGVLAYRGLLGPDRRQAWIAAMSLTALLAANSAWNRMAGEPLGRVELERPGASGAPGLRIALLQSGIDSRSRSSTPTDALDLARLVDLSVEFGRGADLLVWPESSFRGLWPSNSGLLGRDVLGRLAVEHILLGAPWLEDPMQGGELAVAAVLLDAEGRIEGRHLKTRLVPIAEDRRLGSWRRHEPAIPSYSPAPASDLLTLGSVPLGVSICYEALFESIARRQAVAGAQILIHLSNESWLGASMQGQDHMLAAAILRSIEVRRASLRATTTGHTAAIDATGRIVARLPSRSAGVLRVRVTPSTRATAFARVGSTPLVVACLAWTAVRLGRRGAPVLRRASSTNDEN